MRTKFLYAFLFMMIYGFGAAKADILTVNVSVTEPFCAGANGELVITVSGGVVPYTVQLDGIVLGIIEEEGGSVVAGPIPAGTFLLDIMDSVGEEYNAPLTINEPLPLDVQVSNVICYDAPNNQLGGIELFIVGGTPPYEYAWNDPFFSTSQNVYNLPPSQEYSVTVTDVNGCTMIKEGITVAPILTDFSFIRFSAWPFIIEVTDLNGPINPSFSDGQVFVGEPGILFTGNANYNLPVSRTETDATICVPVIAYDFDQIISSQFSINYDPSIVEFTGSQNYGLPDLSAGNIGHPIPGNITFSWATNDMANGTTVPDSFSIVELCFQMLGTAEEIDLQSNSPVCASDPLVVSGNILTENWQYTGPDGTIYTGEILEIPAATLNDAGDYTLLLENDYGCGVEEVTTVEVLDFDYSISNDTTICPGAVIQLNVTPTSGSDYVYLWTPAIGLDNPLVQNPLANPSVTTLYYVEVVSTQSGCSKIDSVLVTVDPEADPLPIISLPSPATICAGEDLFLDCVLGDPSGFVFNWTGPNGYSSTTCELFFPTISIDASGIYTLTITSITGCSTTTQFELIVESPPQAEISYTPSIFCSDVGYVVSVEESPQFTYAWSPELLFSDPTLYNPTLTLSETTTIAVTVTDNNSGCETILEETIPVDSDCVWPGDTDTNAVVNNFDLLNIGLGYGSTGPARPSASLDWLGQGAADWGESTLVGVNYKHLDCNGDGLIEVQDTLAISQNWGLMHNLVTDPDQSSLAQNRDMAAPFFVQPDTLEPNAAYSLPIILGEETLPAEDVYGLAFTIVYDPAIIVPSSASLSVENSWLGEWGVDLIGIQKNFNGQGRLELAMTRIDGQAMSGFGEIGRYNIIVEDIIFIEGTGEDRGENLTTYFEIVDVLVIDANGEAIEVDLVQNEFEIISSITSTTPQAIPWRIFPNPAQDHLYIETPNNQIQFVRLWNALGELVFEKTDGSSSGVNLPITQFAPGIYWIEVQTQGGNILHKRVIFGR